MKRKKKIKGLCGHFWEQTEYAVRGIISMECNCDSGYYLTTKRYFVEEECLNTCFLCENKDKQLNIEKEN